MKKAALTVLAAVAVCGLSLLLITPGELAAQWGAIQQGVDAARGAKKATEPAKTQEPAKSESRGGLAHDPNKPTFTAATTLKNTDRKFSFTIPAGWQQLGGDVNAEQGASFGKPGTTMGFNFHYTRMVPSFPAKASVDASLKQAKEEVTINKLLSAKRRDQGMPGKKGVIGWEIVEASRPGSGSAHQRIIWQCYDGDNYYFNFMAASSPEQFNASRAELQRIVDSVKFGN